MSVSPEKVATPFDVVTESVPPSVEPPGLVASATLTVLLADVTTLPYMSSIAACRPKPAAGRDAGRGLLRDHDLRGAEGSHGDGGRSGRRRGSCRRPNCVARGGLGQRQVRRNVATPWFAVTVSVPPSVAPPGLFASATVTVPLKEDSRLPELSSASTVRPKGCPRRGWRAAAASRPVAR